MIKTPLASQNPKKFIDIILKKDKPKKIIIFSRDELKQYHMKAQLKKYNKIIRYFIDRKCGAPRTVRVFMG